MAGLARADNARMSTVQIRPAAPADIPVILRFIRDLAIYEKAEDQAQATPAQLQATLFAPEARAHALICEREGRPIGFAVYFFNYSTWQGRHGLYLEDLYVDPAARGSGAGKALLQHLARIAVARDCGRFEWSVLDWNQPAIDFYESLQAKPQAEWVRYRLTGDALMRLAEQPA